MSPRPKGSVRRSQLITTYGVGAVVAVEDESFMVAAIDRWDVSGPNLHEPRLERELGVTGFVVPPASEEGNDVPVVRFPAMYSCSTCHRLDRHGFFTSPEGRTCNICGTPLVPSRFVAACRLGHIDDFPYFNWVHADRPRSDVKEHELSIDTEGTTSSLRGIVISCSCGVPPATMEGAFGRDALREIKRCTGKRPWISSQEEKCTETPRTLQRGASNVWFSITRSALSIPPWSEGAFKVLNRHWPVLRVLPEDALRPTVEGLDLVTKTEFTIDDLIDAVKRRKALEGGEGQSEPLREQEFDALLRGRPETSRKQDFVCVPAEGLKGAAADWLDRVMIVKRLREVRVLESFTRVLPPGPETPPEERGEIFQSHPGWLPGVDVNGEGLFLQLDGDRLRGWETRQEVADRASGVNEKYAARFAVKGEKPDRVISPRFLLVHTLAHALIDGWALDSGYPAASLAERLYVSDEMAGLLIYTATSDSAGSLGGVIGQAEPTRLNATLKGAVSRVAWCSFDPLCSEAVAAGVDALNLAACHACILLPEVSCEERNVLLDRGMLVGIPDSPGLGFFAPLLDGS